MAEESTNNQAESQIIEPEDGDEKAYPIETITITKGPPKVAARYLSTPKGSCHDLCKYGIQHAAAEAKPRNAANKRVTTSTGDKKTKAQEENVTSLAGTKKSGSNSKPSPTSKIGSLGSPVDIKEVINEKTVNSEKNSPPFEEIDVSTTEHNNSDLRKAQHSEPSPFPVEGSSKSLTKREKVKNKVAFGSGSRKDIESSSKQKTRLSLNGDKEKSMPTSSPLSSKHKKPSSLSAKTSKNLKRVSSQKDHENVEEAKPEQARNDNIPDKIVHVIEPTSENLSEEPTLPSDETKLPSSSPSPSRDKSLKKTSKKTGNSGVSASTRKGLRHAGHGTRPSASISLLSSGSKSKKSHSVSRSTSVSSVSSSNTSHGKQHSTATSKYNKTGNGAHGENVKEGYKVKPRMSTVVGAATKVVARKLTFRRGKVIELQPQSNNIPRRLKFRPVRILGDENHRDTSAPANVKTEKAVPRFQVVEGLKKRSIARKVGGRVDGSKPGSEEVILRHPSVEGKKVNPRLYNNVIEETASMLAELRKSKVKALVGAFETVISLDSPREATPAEVSTPC